MRIRAGIAALALGGCNALLGLDPVGLGGDDDDPAVDAADPPDAFGNCEQVGHDEDVDGIEDPCDRCIHVADPDQLDADRDTIGDLCDPDRFPSGERRAWYDVFQLGPSAAWIAESGTWGTGSDSYAQTSLGPFAVTHRGPALSDVVVDATIDVLQTDFTDGSAGIGLWIHASAFTEVGLPSGYRCRITRLSTGTTTAALEAASNTTANFYDGRTLDEQLGSGARYQLRLSYRTADQTLECEIRRGGSAGTTTLAAVASELGVGEVALSTDSAAIEVAHVVVLEPR